MASARMLVPVAVAALAWGLVLPGQAAGADVRSQPVSTAAAVRHLDRPSLVAAQVSAPRQLIINTIAAWDRESYMWPFGAGTTQTYGQTFTAPAGKTRLQSLSFVVRLDATVKFRAFVYEWNQINGRPIGNPLYVSGVRHTNGYTWQRVRFTLNVGVAAAKQYVAIMSVTGVAQDPAPNEGRFGFIYDNDAYPRGSFIFFVNDVENNDTVEWTKQGWNLELGPNDLAFQAVFVKAQPGRAC